MTDSRPAEHQRRNLTDMLDQLREVGENGEGEQTSVGEIIRHFESRGFGPLILIPGLIAALPTGAIPGMPIICAAWVLLVAIQMLFGRSNPWLPARLREFSFDRDKLQSAAEKAKKVSRRVDKLLKHRLDALTGPACRRVVALVSVLLAVAMVPIGLIPGLVFIPALAITLFGLGLTARDGALIVIGFVLAAASAGSMWWFSGTVAAFEFWPF